MGLWIPGPWDGNDDEPAKKPEEVKQEEPKPVATRRRRSPKPEA